MGVWIETKELTDYVGRLSVTPYVGVWIETRERRKSRLVSVVTPYVGVWIETIDIEDVTFDPRHTLRGCVD